MSSTSTIQKRAAEERARELLLRCDEMESCRRRLIDEQSGPIEFSPEDVLKQEERELKASSSAGRSVSSDDTRSTGTISRSAIPTSPDMCADDYRKVLRSMQENSALKTDKLNTEITSLKLELANARFELEQSTLALRNAEKEKDELRACLNKLVAGSQEATLSLGEENAVLARKMQELRAERDALLLENKMLKNSSQHSGGVVMSSSSQHSMSSSKRLGLSARLQRVKLATGEGSSRKVADGSNDTVISVETASVSSDPTLEEVEDCDSQGSIAEVTTTSGPSLGFRASTLRN